MNKQQVKRILDMVESARMNESTTQLLLERIEEILNFVLLEEESDY